MTGTWENAAVAHRDIHPVYVEGCDPCRWASVSVAPSALETRGAAVRHANQKDRELDKDLSAYKRLRHDGLQPKSVDGAYALEHSDIRSQFDIDLGHVVPKEKEGVVREGFDMCKEMGLMA